LKIFVILFIFLILASLGSALYFLIKDKGNSTRTARALTWRVVFSIALFSILMLAYHFGFIRAWFYKKNAALLSAALFPLAGNLPPCVRCWCGLQPVDEYEQQQPYHVDEVPVPRHALKAEMVVRRKVPRD
jgi:hypothetical protein